MPHSVVSLVVRIKRLVPCPQESANCRIEGEYAMQLRKPMIPLMMESDYKPNGWLGLIVGEKLWSGFFTVVLWAISGLVESYQHNFVYHDGALWAI